MYKGKVLIVDDDPCVRDYISDTLSECGGHETDTSKDGIDGIEKIRCNEYDVVFTDLSMPRLNGIDLLREIKKVDPTLPVVMITGFSTLDIAISAMKEGASDFIEKPFKMEKVLSTAERLIRQRRLLGKISSIRDYESSVERINAELFKKLQEIATLQAVSMELDGLYDNKELYEKIIEMASRLLMVNTALFGILDNGYLKIKSAIGMPVKREINIAGTYLERVIGSKSHFIAQPGEVNPFEGGRVTFPLLSIPLTLNDETLGILTLSNKSDGAAFTDDEIYLALTFAKKAALRMENNALYESIYTNLINTLKSLVSTIEARDPHTKQHSERVALYALEIADVMRLSWEEKEIIRFGGYLHDIGKIGVRDTILLKPARLTPEEMAEVRLHPIIGDNIVKPIRFLQKERELILYHHERIDGKGYPYGIGGNEIPLTVRILGVADVYDAITSPRAYRPALSHEYAIDVIRQGSNTQFDADIVRAFLQTQTGRGIRDGTQ
jgi:putative nucleotidyltransferase with HDIG domain